MFHELLMGCPELCKDFITVVPGSVPLRGRGLLNTASTWLIHGSRIEPALTR